VQQQREGAHHHHLAAAKARRKAQAAHELGHGCAQARRRGAPTQPALNACSSGAGAQRSALRTPHRCGERAQKAQHSNQRALPDSLLPTVDSARAAARADAQAVLRAGATTMLLTLRAPPLAPAKRTRTRRAPAQRALPQPRVSAALRPLPARTRRSARLGSALGPAPGRQPRRLVRTAAAQLSCSAAAAAPDAPPLAVRVALALSLGAAGALCAASRAATPLLVIRSSCLLTSSYSS
jgi:hypothetical protein